MLNNYVQFSLVYWEQMYMIYKILTLASCRLHGIGLVLFWRKVIIGLFA